MFGMPQPRRMWARITRDVVNNNKSNRNRRFRLMCLPIESRSAFSTIIPSPCRLCVHGKNKRLVCSTVSGYWLIIFSIVVISMLLLITNSSWENYSDEIIWFSGAAKCTKEWRRHQRWVEQYFSHEEKKNCNWWWLQSLVVMPGSRILFLLGGKEKKLVNYGKVEARSG